MFYIYVYLLLAYTFIQSNEQYKNSILKTKSIRQKMNNVL